MIRTPGRLVCRMLIAFTLSMSSASLVMAQDQTPSEQAWSDQDVAALEPGQFAWHPEAAPAGPVSIIVSLPLQIAYVYRSNVLIGVSTISTGKPGHDTPTGTFNILEKQVKHRSTLYSDAPMPFMQRLTWDGIALHAGVIPGYPASHGCVRLPAEFAQALFGVTQRGASVMITDDAPSSPQEAWTTLSGNVPAEAAPQAAPLPTLVASNAP